MIAPAARETLARAVTEPEKPRNLTALQGEIEALAEDDPDFRQELAKRLQEANGAVASQHAVTRGNRSTTIQVTGSNNRIGKP